MNGPPATPTTDIGAPAMQRVFDAVFRLVGQLLALSFLFAVLLNVGNVIGRYAFGWTVGWADEVQVFILIAMAFLGAAVASWRGIHLRMDVLVRLLPLRLQRALLTVELVLILTLSGFVAWESTGYLRVLLRLGQASDVGGIPLWIPHASILLGFTLIFAATAWRLWDSLQAHRSLR